MTTKCNSVIALLPCPFNFLKGSIYIPEPASAYASKNLCGSTMGLPMIEQDAIVGSEVLLLSLDTDTEHYKGVYVGNVVS